MKQSGGQLATELDQALVYERRTALRALLRRPLLAADPRHEAEFLLVRRHADELRDWLARHPGWILQVDSELARLRKVPASLEDGSRPARDPKSGTPFSKRRYVLLCLALAVLEGADRQTTLGWLADQVVRLVTIDPELERNGIVFDLTSRGQRRDLVHVVRLLHDLRVLTRLDGDEELYLKGHGDVLYNIHRPALAAMLNVRRGPSTVEAEGFEQRLAAIVEEPMPESDEARRRRLRSTLTRRLLDDPVLEYEDLDDDELTYLQGQRSFLLGRIRERTGLVPEVRREGIAMVDERDELSDQKMPEKGTDGHLTLLLAEYLAVSARRDAGNGSPAAVGWAALERHAAELVARHRKHWRKDVSEPGAEVELCRDAVARLEALHLVRCTPDGVQPRPAIGRYAVDEATIQGASGTQGSLLGLLGSDPGREGSGG